MLPPPPPETLRQAGFTRHAGFTLVELLVSMAILAILLLVLSSVFTQTTKAWRSTSGKIEQFRQARDAFESMTRQISEATLNTYWDYDSPTAPTRYIRQSELRFISGSDVAGTATGTPPRPTHSIFFQAPLGLVNQADLPTYGGLPDLLNTWGYYIEYKDDSLSRPSFVAVPTKTRFRLMELMEPSESMTLYTYTSGVAGQTYTNTTWFTTSLNSVPATAPVHVLADNVIALVLLPKLTPEEDPTGTLLAPTYQYDSTSSTNNPVINPKNQLPPVIQMTMVAIDEVSASRLSAQDNTDIQNKISTLFTTASQYTNDLATLGTFLVGKKINYRIFTTNLSIKGAKWSRSQIN